MTKKNCPCCGQGFPPDEQEHKTETPQKDLTLLLLPIILMGVIALAVIAITVVEDSKYNYPDCSSLLPEEIAGVKSGYQAGYEDGTTNATNGDSLIGTAWGYGYHYGWTDGQKEYLKRK